MSLFQNSGKNNKNCRESLNSYATSCEPSKNTETSEDTFCFNKRRSVTFSSVPDKDINPSINNTLTDSQFGNSLTQLENCNLKSNPISTTNQTQKSGKTTFYKNFNPFHKTSSSKKLFNNDDERLPLKATEVINQPSIIDRQQVVSSTNNNNSIPSNINNKKISNQESSYNSKFTKFFLTKRHSPLRPLIKPIDNIENIEKLGPQQPSTTALLPKIFGIRHSLTGGTLYVGYYI